VIIEGIDDEIKYELSPYIKTKKMVITITMDIEDPSIKIIEMICAKTLKISTKLTNQQEWKLLDVLKRKHEALAWDYNDIKGIHPSICTHHIYIKE
jgi:hypothetical protein